MAAASRESFISMEAASPATPWHSPLPYLFGSLATISTLIAFSLSILACSYCWKVYLFVLNGEDRAARAADIDSGQGKVDNDRNPLPPAVLDDNILVIMAGEVNPSFIATPMSLSLDCSKIMRCHEKGAGAAGVAVAEHGDGDQLQSGSSS